MTDYNEIKKQVEQLLAENGINFNTLFCGASSKDGWECDSWRVTLHKPRKLVDLKWTQEKSAGFDYYTGTGHRNKQGKAKAPEPASVLHCLAMDARLAEDTFEDFCSCLGYDTDSRKALDTYLQCQKNGSDLRSVLGSSLLGEISDLLQDY